MRTVRLLARALRPLQLQLRHSFTCSSHNLKVVSSTEAQRCTHSALLEHRSLVRVEGQEANAFLQGLITADVSILAEQQSLYSMLLNAQGRVLYDIMLYHAGADDILLECDVNATSDVVKHLKRYALRSKVDICAVPDLHVWSLFPGQPSETIATCLSFADPRIRSLGTRVLGKADTCEESIKALKQASLFDYHCHRLKVGLAEGVDEIPVGGCFPLEYNLDYLNGVSFNKGCYLGQELTARTHHTGVVRKRVIPISLKDNSCEGFDVTRGTPITSSSGKSAGKLICLHGDKGLALLRIQEASKEGLFMESLEGRKIDLTAHRPEWWPAND